MISNDRLKKMGEAIDKQLESETKESLEEWLNNKRKVKVMKNRLNFRKWKLSGFQKKMIWLLVILGLGVFSFSSPISYTQHVGAYQAFIVVLRVYSIMGFVVWGFGLSRALQTMIAFRYKIIEDEDNTFAVKYLTIAWLIIPYWKKIPDIIQHSNGIGCSSCYYDIKDKGTAIERISHHKRMQKEQRKLWFKMQPRPEYPKVTYI